MLPFTTETYANAVGLFREFLGPDEFGPDPEDDPMAHRTIEVFLASGIKDLNQLRESEQDATVEVRLAHDVTAVLARACIDLAARDPSPASWLAAEAADVTSRHAPIARGDDRFTVNRSERVVLEAACATFLSLLEPEALAANPHPGQEAAAQVTGLLLAQWFVWNQPYAFAAFNKEDLIPGA